jgi:cytochrome P450
MEARVFFDELFDRVRDIEQAGPASRLRSNFTNGLKRLPVRYEAR